MLKWLKRISLAVVVLAALAVGVVYGWSSYLLARAHPIEERSIILSSRPDVIAHGERIAQLYGCYDGCHGEDMEGSVFFEEKWVARAIAPSLETAMNRYSTAELEAIIRQGVRPDGTSVAGMPSASFSTMTDNDLSAVLSFIRSYEGGDAKPGTFEWGPLGRAFLVAGMFNLAADEPHGEPWKETDRSEPMGDGAYLASNVCSECHGLDLEGNEDFTPSLTVAKAYSREQFQRLMREGVGLGERDLGLMSEVARNRFAKMTPEEVEHLYTYLHAR